MLQNIGNFFSNYWDSILVIAVFVAAIVFLMYRGKKGVVDKMIFMIVTELEREYGSGTGKLKLAAAIEQLYPRLPAIIRMFTTSQGIVNMIEKGLEKAKEIWDSDQSIEEYVDWINFLDDEEEEEEDSFDEEDGI